MSDVKWYGSAIKGQAKAATEAACRKLAFDIEAQAKSKITDNDQIDTGFMRNSTYTVTRNGITGGAASGMFGGLKRESAPAGELGDAIAGVGVGAVYAIYQETQQSFLRAALDQVAGNAGFVVRAAFKDHGF